jgi:Tfp pilus assembly protein PilW
MPVMRRHSSAPALRSEAGTTLMELLVAMVAGIVVVAALLAILEFSTNQATRISDRVQATRIGRLAMARVMDELRSTCTGFHARASQAIQGPSSTPTAPLASTGATDLWFISTFGTGEGSKAEPKKVTEHDIHWAATGAKTPTGKALGTLTDYRFESTGGNSEAWTFQPLTVANASARVIAQNIIAPAQPATATIFQYSKFKTEESTELIALKASEVPAAAAAKEVAQVSVSFVQAPEGRDTTPSSAVGVSNSILLRFNATEGGAEPENVPCA